LLVRRIDASQVARDYEHRNRDATAQDGPPGSAFAIQPSCTSR
jgi:hypothetical protein